MQQRYANDVRYKEKETRCRNNSGWIESINIKVVRFLALYPLWGRGLFLPPPSEWGGLISRPRPLGAVSLLNPVIGQLFSSMLLFPMGQILFLHYAPDPAFA